MPGVPRELAEHKLKVYPQARPIRQKLRRFTPDKREAIRAELARLVAAGFIREVLHPEWLANPVLVLKKNKVDWRMCVDYTDLNKHCPKDPFGLPRIDQVVDSTAGCSVLSFLNCYSGYHQISLAKEDEEKTAFITPFGAFCYTSMSFGLKNAGATYQRAIQTCLADHWGKRVEAYVDDVVIKTENSENFIEDLQLVFNSLRRYRWKLNPKKCVFGVPVGKLLEFIVSHRGIEANPDKIEAIMILEALRKKVFDKNEKFAGKWIRELPYVVWSLRTQPSRALHGNTPFFMVYGSEAVLPADLKFGAPRLVFESIAEAEPTRLEDIDVLEEEWLNTVIQSARYQQTLRCYHDKAVRRRSFSVGDLILRRILTGEGRHKLPPLWEGPFIVAEFTRPGSYRLTQMDGTEIGNSWNIEHLRKFYP
jgi:hypothetical protein